MLTDKDIGIEKRHSIIHIGGCDCDEIIEYSKYIPANRIVFVEPVPKHIQKARYNHPHIDIREVVIYSTDDEYVDFHLTSSNNTGSSSLLKLKNHLIEHPTVLQGETIKVRTKKLDTLVRELGWCPEFLVLDTQGSELNILKSAPETLSNPTLKSIYTEVNFNEMYEGCGLWLDLKNLIESYGFIFIDADKWFYKEDDGQGNALFERN